MTLSRSGFMPVRFNTLGARSGSLRRTTPIADVRWGGGGWVWAQSGHRRIGVGSGRVGRREQSPLALDAPESAAAPVPEGQTGADHEVLDGAGGQDLARLRFGCDTRPDVHGDAPDVVS